MDRLGKVKSEIREDKFFDKKQALSPAKFSEFAEISWRITARRTIARGDVLSFASNINFCFHDLRHTAASHMVMSGVDVFIVQEILEHKTIQMTRRYSHLSPKHKRTAMEALENALGKVDTKTDT